jgi:signal transduction histidine kinase
MKITPKILIPNLLSLSLLAFMLLYLVYQLGVDRTLLDEQSWSIQEASRTATELDQLQRRLTDLLSRRYDRLPGLADSVHTTSEQMAALARELHDVTVTPRGKALLRAYESSLEVSQRMQVELLEALRRGDRARIDRAYDRWDQSGDMAAARLNDLLIYKTLALARILSDIDRRRGRISLIVGVLTVFAFVALLASSVYYRRVLAKPILHLTEVANRIARGEVDTRIQLAPRKDEVESLALAFNHMADRLVSANEDLERKVEERTGELAQANRALRREISERVRAQEALLQSERLAAVGQMITGLSHESRNALQRVQACLDLLAKRIRNNDKLLFLVEEARRAQTDLRQVYEGVRHYAGPITLEVTPNDLREIWRGTWALMNAEREGRDVSLVELTDGTDLRCHVDPFRMGQVFRNLMENSLAACADPVRIEIKSEPALLNGRPAVRIVFQDNGPGLDPESEQRIFEPFFTTKTKGTGLGMSIVKRIVEAHGGAVAAYTAERSGLTVELLMPCRGESA